MSGKRYTDIRAGRTFPKATELESGFPFYWGSIRADMCIWAERMLRRKPEELDTSWDCSRYLVALRSLRDGARDSLKADEHLVELVLQVADALPPWALTEHRRCRVFLSRLRAQPQPMDDDRRRAVGGSVDVDAGEIADRQTVQVQANSLARHPACATQQANDHPGRAKDILAGKAWPEAMELLCGMPFFKGSLHEDMRHYAGRLLGGIERDGYKRDDWNDYEVPIIHHARHLQEAASNRASTRWNLRPIVDRLMFTFPTGYHEGWLRCSHYRAALGVRGAKVDIASTAVSLALVSAEAGSPSESDCQLIAAALGWLAEVAVDDPALVGQQKPARCWASEETARRHGQTLIDFVRTRLRRDGS